MYSADGTTCVNWSTCEENDCAAGTEYVAGSLSTADSSCSACMSGTFRIGDVPCDFCDSHTVTGCDPGFELQAGNTTTNGLCTQCGSGKYQELYETDVECKFCAAGFAFDTTSTVCTPCDAGMYQDQSNSVSATCSACGVGAYASSASACTACEGGKFQELTTAATSCTTCADGTTSDEGAAACAGCVQGKAGTGGSCAACDPGTQQISTGETACTDCVAGKWSDATVAASVAGCTDCGAGTASAATDGSAQAASACVTCVDGETSDDGAATCAACTKGAAGTGGSCTDCVAGTQQTATGQSACTDCVAGKWSDTDAAQSDAGCTACGAGKASAATAAQSDVCDTCDDGATSDDGAATCVGCIKGKAGTGGFCDACVAGTQQTVVGQSVCDVCADGKWSDVTVAQSAAGCTACGAGTYTPNDVSACVSCEPGKFQELATAVEYACKTCAIGTGFVGIAVACTPCTGGAYQDQTDTADVTCQTCAQGKFTPNNSAACTPCAAGAYRLAATAAYTCASCPAVTGAMTVQCTTGSNSVATLCGVEGDTYAPAVDGACKCEDIQANNFETIGACTYDARINWGSSSTDDFINKVHLQMNKQYPDLGGFSMTDVRNFHNVLKNGLVDVVRGTKPYRVIGRNATTRQLTRAQAKASPTRIAKTTFEFMMGVGGFQSFSFDFNGVTHAIVFADGSTAGSVEAVTTGRRLDASCFSATSTVVDGVYTFEPDADIQVSKSCAVLNVDTAYTATLCGTNSVSQETDWLPYTVETFCKCPSGFGSNSFNPTTCEACSDSSNHFNTQFDTSACGECPDYTTSHDSEHRCACDAGYVGAGYLDSSDTDDGTCTQCTGQYYQDETDQSDCKTRSVCPAGTYRLGATASVEGTCTACTAGMYQDDFNQESCDPWTTCNPGFTRTDGTTSTDATCTACDTGKYQDQPNQASCEFCVAGKQFAGTTVACDDCASGKYQESNSQASATCDFCVAGKFFTNKYEVCDDCAAGEYQNSNSLASATCKLCTPGTRFTATTTACDACAIGKYQHQTVASAECEFCVAGKSFTCLLYTSDAADE